MTPDSITNKRLVALFLLGCVLFNYPILSLVNVNALVMGIPLLYLYLFAVWAILIGLVIWIMPMEKNRQPSEPR